MARKSMMYGLSEGLKEAIGEFAAANDQSMADVIRSAVAAKIGYDLEKDAQDRSEGRRGRPKVYGSKEERRAASRQRSKDRRALTKQLLEDFNRQQAKEQLAKMAESVEAREQLVTERKGKKKGA
jgi:hypothetical protein